MISSETGVSSTGAKSADLETSAAGASSKERSMSKISSEPDCAAGSSSVITGSSRLSGVSETFVSSAPNVSRETSSSAGFSSAWLSAAFAASFSLILSSSGPVSNTPSVINSSREISSSCPERTASSSVGVSVTSGSVTGVSSAASSNTLASPDVDLVIAESSSAERAVSLLS